MHIGYVLDVFPVLSETFIVREIEALERRGETVTVFAITHRTAAVMHAESAARLDSVRFLSTLQKRRRKVSVLPLHLVWLMRRPGGYLRALSLALRGSAKVRRCFFWAPLHAEHVRAANIAHLHAHFVLDGCLHAMFVSLLTGTPYSVTVHAHDIFHPKYAELRDEKLRRAAFVAAISRFNKAFIESHYPSVDPDKVRIVRCGIDLDRFRPVAAGPESGLKILAVGRLVEQKGFTHLIEACGVLAGRGVRGYSVDIVGEGPEREVLESRIRELHLEGVVTLLGQRDQAFVQSALDRAALFVLPCVPEASGLMDGIPVALMEAMAKGVPVISTRVSGVPELIVDGGYVVAPGDAEALADSIDDILAMRGEDRRALGERGREIVAREFNIDREAAKLATLIAA